jgi:dienelactone hydrolase/Tol biopolymer transport system component
MLINKILLTASCALTASQLCAQQPDYRLAESRLAYNTEALVDNSFSAPQWQDNGTCWYRTLTTRGSEYILVNPAKATRSAAFDQEKLAASLSRTSGHTYKAYALPFRTFRFINDGKSITFNIAGTDYTCDLQSYQVTKSAAATTKDNRSSNEVASPDGHLAAFIKDYNLWVRELPNGPERALTTDGVKDFGYATDNAGWHSSDAPVLRWSKDSRKIATFKQDQRNVSDMYLVTTNIGKPTLKAWKYPLAGDAVIPMIQRVIIDVNPAKVITLQVPADAHRGTLSDDISSSGTFDDVDWSDDNTELAFVSTSRNHKHEQFRIANANTGAVREVFDEKVATQYESGQDAINWRYLQKTNEIIWFSERDDWGHLYLYDAKTGRVKNQVTKGNWLVTGIEQVDEKNRVIYFIACGLDARNPYFRHFCKVNFDGSGFTDLTPETGNHKYAFSPDKKYIIDSYSQPDVPAVTVLRNRQGKVLLTLEKTAVNRLQATGWKAPTPVTVKAHDGKTDIYGLVFTPANLDATKKYPVIDYIYPGPQGGGVRDWSFSSARNDHQALAELGFVVVILEGTSNPLRSKSYHDMNYGNMAENTLPDQIGGIRQLAARYPYMDTSRVGIWGHSGGGFATAAAMFRYPDFFRVGISESGNHENRNYEDDWGERYNGLITEADYAAQANPLYAGNLKGKLLLAHGLMDDNVPPYNTFLVIDALTKANKDYDLIIFPHARHGFGADNAYMMRRRWDYFIRNLQQREPPKEYQLVTKPDPRN